MHMQKWDADLRPLWIALAALSCLGYRSDKLKIPIYAVPF